METRPFARTVAAIAVAIAMTALLAAPALAASAVVRSTRLPTPFTQPIVAEKIPVDAEPIPARVSTKADASARRNP